MRLAIITSTELPQLSSDDARLPSACRRAGFDTEFVAWDDPAVDWSRFDLLLVRTTGRFPSSEEWWDWIEARGDSSSLRGAPTSERANMYGLGHNARLPIVPLRYAAPSRAFMVADLEIIQPLAGGVGAPRFLVRKDDPAGLRDVLGRVDSLGGRWLIRTAYPTLWTRGELSLVFFGARFSHAVRRVPAPDSADMSEAGGATIEPLTPDANTLAFARAVIDRAHSTIYRRLDLIETPSELRIMETPSADVDLFFRFTTGGEERLASAMTTLCC